MNPTSRQSNAVRGGSRTVNERAERGRLAVAAGHFVLPLRSGLRVPVAVASAACAAGLVLGATAGFAAPLEAPGPYGASIAELPDLAPLPPVAAADVGVEVTIESKTATVEPEVVEMATAAMEKGTERVVDEGQSGSVVTQWEVTSVEGREVSRVQRLTVVTPPRDRVVEIGTGEPVPTTGNGPNFSQEATSQQSAAGNRAIGQQMASSMYGWSGDQWACLLALWNRESGWSHVADNPSSSAYGIPQALPGSKMASAGADWATNPATQIAWGLGYVKGRYGNPCNAWAHSEEAGWY